MQLFSRRVLMAGPPGRVAAYATDMQAYVSERYIPKVVGRIRMLRGDGQATAFMQTLTGEAVA